MVWSLKASVSGCGKRCGRALAYRAGEVITNIAGVLLAQERTTSTSANPAQLGSLHFNSMGFYDNFVFFVCLFDGQSKTKTQHHSSLASGGHMSAETLHEVAICLAALTGEQASDKKPSIATAFTAESDGLLISSQFYIFDALRHNHRALLHSLRKALDSIPADTARVTIICGNERLIRLGGSGELPADHRRHWEAIRLHLAGFETTWKLASDTDERQQALSRCLRSLLRDPSLAGQRLATPSRRSRRAGIRQQTESGFSPDDSIRHSNVIDKLEASAKGNVPPWLQSQVEWQSAVLA